MRRGKIFLALMLSASMTVSSVCPAIAADAGEVKTEASASDKAEKKAEEKKAEEKKAEEKKAEEKKAEEKKAEEKKDDEKASEEKKEKDEKADEKTEDKKEEAKDSEEDKKDSDDKEEKASGDSEKDEDSKKDPDKETAEEKTSDKDSDGQCENSSIEEAEAKTETDHALSSVALLRAAEDEEKADSDGEDEKAAEFKVVEEKLVKQGDDVTAQLTLSGTDIDYLYLGTKSDAEKADKDDWIEHKDKVTCQIGGEKKDCFLFVIPVKEMDTELKLAYHDAASGEWLDRDITFKSSDLEDEEKDDKEDEDKETGPAADAGIADGTYTAKVSYTGTMFRVVDNKLTVKDGKATIHITLSGSGYNALYEGSVAAAQAAANTELYTVTGQAKYTDEFGTATGYTFDIPVPVFDKAFDVAARGTKSGKWFAKTITVSSEGLKSSDSKTNSDTGSKTDTSGSSSKSSTTTKDKTTTASKTTKVDKTVDTESKYVSDLSGSTKKVDAATGLADGVYSPDRFTWSGGTGKVHITCKKISVKGGKAYATIQFSSGAYPYVKASGNKYTGSHTTSTSTFVIPVALNKNNTIIGMTTKMSANHEIKYSLFIYLAAAASGADALNTNKENPASTDSLISSGNKELDEEAPSIVGLDYKEEASVTEAELFKMFKYDNGITLIEIDMKSKTARALTEDNAAASDTVSGEENTDGSAATEASDTNSNAVAEASDTDSSAAAEADSGVATDESDADSSSTDTTTASDSYDETMADDVVVETTEEQTAKLYQNNIVKYLIVPEGEEVPVGLEKDAIIVQKPVDSIYVSSEESLSFLKKLNLTDKITSCGWDEATCSDADLKKEITDGKVAFAGSWDDTQMKTIVGAGGQLALLPSDILAKESDDASQTTAEKEEAMQSIAQKYAMLHIPMLVDRSADESTEQGKAEWAQVYGALFDVEKQDEQLSK